MTLNCLARAGCDKDLEAIGTTEHKGGKTGQLFVFVRPFSVRDEAARATTFEGAGISRTGTVQEGLGDCRVSDRSMPKCGLSDPTSDSLRYKSAGICVTPRSTLSLFLYLAVVFSPLRLQKGKAPLINDSRSLIVFILMEQEEEREEKALHIC